MVLRLNFKGLMAPAFTPFSRNTGELDISIIQGYVQHLIKNGIQGVLVNGSVGEGVCMSIQERKTVAEAWLEAAKNSPLHVMVHIGGPSLRDVQELARHAESRGAHSLLCLPDLFHRPSNVNELIHYLSLVGKAAPNTPLLYYHYPVHTSVTLDMAEFLKAVGNKIPTFVGLKFTHNNLEEGSRCLRVNNGQYSVLLGNDYLISAAFCEGFDSLIATTLNMFGPLIKGIHDSVQNLKLDQARASQLELIKAIETITKYGKWAPTMKEAMHIITGLDFGAAREPQGILTADHVQQLQSDLTALKLAK